MASLVIVDGGAQLSFMAFTASAANATTYTFTDIGIGDPDPSRRIIVDIGSVLSAAGATISSATLGGNALAIHNQTTAGASVVSGIGSALASTGTTATIEVTMSAGALNLDIGIYRMVGETVSSPHAIMGDNTLDGSALSGTVDIPTGGVLVAGARFASATAGNSWSGAIEDFDQTPEANAQATGASQGDLTAETGRAVSVTNGGAPANGVLTAISWG